jgi:thymidylate synthase
MRFYANFPEAINELRRELKEMGLQVKTKSVQNLDISNNQDYQSLELQNYTYTVLDADWNDIPVKSREWAATDFHERISGEPLNPGEAWTIRGNYWRTFLVGNPPKFHYTYAERMSKTLQQVTDLLKKDLSTRRAYLAIFDPLLDSVNKLDERIPCSLGYWFNFRNDQLNITYLQRSCDFGEHAFYDMYMATRLKDYVADCLKVKPGTFTHWLGSLHVFAKDVKDVF